MKKMLPILLALLLTMALGCTLAEEKPIVYTSGDFKYILLEDGTAEITNYTGKATSLTIPSELNGYRVTTIGFQAFYNCNSLTSVSIPDSVTSIGENAFEGCPNITFTVERGSFAEQWCQNNGLPFVHPDAYDWLLN